MPSQPQSWNPNESHPSGPKPLLPRSVSKPLPPIAAADPVRQPGNASGTAPIEISKPTRSRPHARSLSDKMFGGRRTGPHKLEAGSLPALNDKYASDGRKEPRHKHDEKDGEAGQCATCDTKVRWARGAAEFRCPTCLMVNDLKPPGPKAQSLPKDQISQSAGHGANPPLAPNGSVLTISVERTQSIISRCIDTYLKTRSTANSSFPHARTPPESPSRETVASPDRQWPGQGDWPTTPPYERAYPQHFAFDDSPAGETGEPVRPTVQQKPPANAAVPRKPLPGASKPVQMPFSRTRPPAHIAMPPGGPLPRHNPSSGARGHASPSDEHVAPQFIPASKIFRPLEGYLARSYGDADSLNGSFMTISSRPRATRPSEGHASSRERPIPSARPAETHIQEMDAKTLLIGDFAENGSWWTGHADTRGASQPRRPKAERKPDRKPEQTSERGDVRIGSKSPLIEWADVEAWYDLLMMVGTNWQDRAQKLDLLESINHRDMAEAFEQGRRHLHKAMLKMTETLVKRPGRPLKESGEIRFLLLLLANPLLYPQARVPRSLDVLQDRTLPSRVLELPVESAWDQGNAFGIIKRIFGLLSNVPNDCHRHLTSWFARYDESRFRSYVDLVQRFLNYRLKRQHGRKKSNHIDPVEGLIPNLSGTHADTSAQLHAALGLGPSTSKGPADSKKQQSSYAEDWQVKAAAKVMAMLFAANKVFYGQRSESTLAEDAQMSKRGSVSRTYIKNHGQLLSTTDFYNTMVDMQDFVADFDSWEATKTRFAFCQYPFFLSVGSKIRLIQHDAKRQMDRRAREAFFDSLLKNKALEQYLVLRVRRDCLVEDSLNGISEAVAGNPEDIKKGLKVQFKGEEGIDAGGLRKEWFLMLMREIFNPSHALFLYDDDSPFCYFNPHSFETSDRYYLVGAVLGLAIYNSTILDVALPPFLFKKLLNSANAHSTGRVPHARSPVAYTLKDLAEYKPALARGLRQLLEYDGDVQETFQRDFVIEVERYDTTICVPLCDHGATRPVTNANRTEFVDLYIRYMLDTQVARQFEPFKRGFFTVTGGNALSLFQPEEIELLVRGSDEPLDVPSLRAVALYDNWSDHAGRPIPAPADSVPLVRWFWELFEAATPADQRRLLGFVTGSDRIPAVGAASLNIRVAFGGPERERLPIARTCFNSILLQGYRSKEELAHKLWMAVLGSEGFGLK